jgi:hypothetical protein
LHSYALSSGTLEQDLHNVSKKNSFDIIGDCFHSTHGVNEADPAERVEWFVAQFKIGFCNNPSWFEHFKIALIAKA